MGWNGLGYLEEDRRRRNGGGRGRRARRRKEVAIVGMRCVVWGSVCRVKGGLDCDGRSQIE